VKIEKPERGMILRIIIVAVLLIAAVLVFAAMKPNTFHLQRAITIKAPPEKIFPRINDFHNWGTWQPQDKDDSTIQRTYKSTRSGRRSSV
jgi:Polyketide cyclase / dehydrase and lipid transport